jgi:hypothetical protein
MSKRPTKYGQMLARWISLRRVTQTAMAQRIRQTTGVPVTQSAISLVIGGQRKVPTYWVEPVSQALGISGRQAELFRKAAAIDHGLELEIPPVPNKKGAPE